MLRFHCLSKSGNPDAAPLVFDWDEHTGTVSGPDAASILEAAAQGGTAIHPLPSYHAFSAEPLKNRCDMAAIVGLFHHLPEALRGSYPVCRQSRVCTRLQLLY